ncbi:hypothetical protein LCGC14_0379020 [marine sediment metagenome]|uniref:Uncharacterized protein n=1 Tax=marine sediment metagenome TaxID=412755 RepID=A0A0F9TL59_9ZZZZ
MDSPSIFIRPGREKKPYRLKCRFKVDPDTRPSDTEKVRVAAQFVEDMRKQGWIHQDGSEWSMTGPYPVITPITIHAPRTPTAKEMMYGVSQGDQFLAPEGTLASVMPTLAESEAWDYELKGVFIREEILTEYPDPHEEERR